LTPRACGALSRADPLDPCVEFDGVGTEERRQLVVALLTPQQGRMALLPHVLARLLLNRLRVEEASSSAALLKDFTSPNMSELVSACFAKLLEILVWQLGEDTATQVRCCCRVVAATLERCVCARLRVSLPSIHCRGRGLLYHQIPRTESALFTLAAVVLDTPKLPAMPGIPVPRIKRLAGLPEDCGKPTPSKARGGALSKRRKVATATPAPPSEDEPSTVILCLSQQLESPTVDPASSTKKVDDNLKQLAVCMLLEKHFFHLLNTISGVMQRHVSTSTKQRALLCLQVRRVAVACRTVTANGARVCERLGCTCVCCVAVSVLSTTLARRSTRMCRRCLRS
jgi:hypothetical protein